MGLLLKSAILSMIRQQTVSLEVFMAQAEKEGITFPPELISFIDEWKAKPGSLIMILHKTQETFDFISRAAAEQIALLTGISLARV